MSCFSKQILDYFYNIQNTGRIIKPEAIGKAGSKKEGTVIEFSWRVKDEIIEDARFRTFGDVNAIAISSIITTMMIGKSVNDVFNITADDVLEHLQSSGANHLYIIDVALNALINTYENYIKKYAKANPDDKKVNEFAENLRKNLEKIENVEEFADDNYDLSNIAMEDNDEYSYLQNLQEYNKNLEDNSIEKSLTKLLQGYTSIDASGEKETVVNSQPKQSTGKRGRPRKERTAEELEALANKVVRGRGRPRKERTPEEIEAELSKPIRGRGRPKKEVVESEIAPQVKKGRGRPKKELSPEEIEALANKVVRGRGRPKKEKSQEELEKAQNEIKRGRGRPKKNQLFNLFDDEDEVDTKVGYNDYMTSNYGNLNVGINTKPINNFDNSNANQFANFEDEDNFDDLIKGASEAENVANTNTSVTKYSNSTYTEVKKGRGRPRKERTAEELEALANKVVRGRGRPRKERTPEEIEAELSKPIRGRGRPKKTVEESETTEPQIKKGRGRPRKQIEPPTQSAEPIVEEKKGRGRPRKEISPEEQTTLDNKVKRGRGRPKKQETSIFRITKLSEVRTAQKLEDNNSEENYNNNVDNSENQNTNISLLSSKNTDTTISNVENTLADNQSNNEELFYNNLMNSKINNTNILDSEINDAYTLDNETQEVKLSNNNYQEDSSANAETKKGRGRPRKERTAEELEALANKVIRGRGRPKKTVEETETIEPQVKKGRGRPKKELSPEEQEALANKVVRGRGRPKKQENELDNNLTTNTEDVAENYGNNLYQENKFEQSNNEKYADIELKPNKEQSSTLDNSLSQNDADKVAGNSMSIGANKIVDEKTVPTQSLIRDFDLEAPNLTIEDSEHHYTTLENSFAPAQNKYGVGISKSTQYNLSIKKTKITKTFATDTKKETSGNRIGVSVIRDYNNPPIAEVEEENREPLSDDVNNLLKNSSIQDALKALLGHDDK